MHYSLSPFLHLARHIIPTVSENPQYATATVLGMSKYSSTSIFLSFILVFLEDVQTAFDPFCTSEYLFGKMKKVQLE